MADSETTAIAQSPGEGRAVSVVNTLPTPGPELGSHVSAGYRVVGIKRCAGRTHAIPVDQAVRDKAS